MVPESLEVPTIRESKQEINLVAASHVGKALETKVAAQDNGEQVACRSKQDTDVLAAGSVGESTWGQECLSLSGGRRSFQSNLEAVS